MKKYTKTEFERILRRNGFNYVRQTGGHVIYKRDGNEMVVIPQNIQEPIALRLIKDHHLDVGKRGKVIGN